MSNRHPGGMGLIILLSILLVSIIRIIAYTSDHYPVEPVKIAGPNPPIIIFVTEFTQVSADLFEESMKLAQKSPQQVIPIIISSHGGEVGALLRMIEAIKTSYIPVATSCTDECDSAGAFLFMMGAEGYRYSSAHANFLIHSIQKTIVGNTDKLAKEIVTLNDECDSIFGLVSINTGHPRDFFLNLIHSDGRVDWWLDAYDARQLNIVNHIGYLKLSWDTTKKMYMVKG